MKKAIFLAVGLCIACSLSAQGYKKYDVKSGIVNLDIVMTIGKTQIKSQKIIYFDDYGVKECEETYSNGKLSGTLFSDGKDRISTNPSEKKATIEGTSTNGVGTRIDINDMGTAEDIKSGKVKKGAPMTMAGQTIETVVVTSKDGATTYGGWNKVMVYFNMPGKTMSTEIKATKLQANVPVPKEKFQVPAGYKTTKM